METPQISARASACAAWRASIPVLAAVLLSVAVSCAAAGQEPPAPYDEDAALDDALRSMGMTWRDLEVNRDRTASEFKSPLVLDFLSHPMKAREYARQFGKKAASSANSMTSEIKLCMDALGMDRSDWGQRDMVELELDNPAFWEAMLRRVGTPSGIEGKAAEICGLDVKVRMLLVECVEGLQAAVKRLREAFSGLTDGEKAFLASWAPALMIPADGRLADFVKAHSAGQDQGRHPLRTVLDIARKVKLNSFCDALAEACRPMLYRGNEFEGVPPDLMFALDTAFGTIVISGTGPHVHRSGDMIIDLGGNDVYCADRIAGCAGSLERPVSFVLDMSGNDTYRCPADFSLGGALMGVALLWDDSGDDFYEGACGTQGAALFGIGMFVDGGGSDVLKGGDFCQGAACFGIGCVFADARESVNPPEAGSDRYSGAGFCQGFSRTMGFGLLLDRSGSDVYVSGDKDLYMPLYGDRYHCLSQGFSIGVREHGAAGSLAMLIDVRGNDRYMGGVHGQGAGCWYGAGFLVDLEGSDHYYAAFDSQGAAVHSAVGVLLDGGGDDCYVLADGLGQGCSHDRSVGILVDSGGDDKYTARAAAQGVGLTNGLGILVDLSGRDLYSGHAGHLQGAGRPHGGSSSIGILLDLGGSDAYGGVGGDGGFRSSAGAGSRLDSGGGAAGGGKCDVPPLPPVSLPDGYEYTAAKFDGLFRLSSAWNVGEARPEVMRARAEIAAWGEKAIPLLKERMKVWDGLLIWGLDSIFEALVAGGHRTAVEAAVLEALNGPEAVPLAHAMRLSAKLKVAQSGPRAMQLMKADPRFWIYTFPIAGALGLREAVPVLAGALSSEDDAAQIEACKALGRIADPSSVPALAACLDAEFHSLRCAAAAALARMGGPAAGALWERACDAGASEPSRVSALAGLCRLPSELKDAAFRDRMAALLADPSWAVRGNAASAFAGMPDSLSPAARLAAASAAEKHPFVLGRMAEAMALLRLPERERKPQKTRSGIVDYPEYSGEGEDE